MDLQLTWYVLIAVLVAGYAALDGFDLGIGALYPFLARNEDQRGLLRQAIGPFWDGNEVWLLTAGGALFAAFPPVYATVFSGFYLALILILTGLILRAVSLEFRAHDPAWRRVWDLAFAVGSLLPALLFGVVAGNLVRGLPLDTAGEYAGGLVSLVHPFSLLVGILGLAVFLSHGASWAALRTEDDLHARAVSWRSYLHWTFVGLLIITTVATAFAAPERISTTLSRPVGWLVAAFELGGLVLARVAMLRSDDLRAFAGSAASVVGLVGLWAVGSFPYLVPAHGGAGDGLSAYEASSSELTLTVMSIVAGVGLPIVIAYTALIYRVLGGRVRLEQSNY